MLKKCNSNFVFRIDLTDELDFVLISMSEGQKMQRYSEVLKDVKECIYRDRMDNESIVSKILGACQGSMLHSFVCRRNAEGV